MWVWIWQDQEQVTKGFRFMGQRFTLDAYVFGQVIWRKVGTLDEPARPAKGAGFLCRPGFGRSAYAILNGHGREPSMPTLIPS